MSQTLFQKELNTLSNSIPFILPDTPIFQYISWLNRLAESPDPRFLSDYKQIVEEAEVVTEHPYLSIITRTQGTRPDMLRDALDSLSKQSDKDFEVLLIGHKLTEVGRERVSQLLEEFPAAFRNKIRFLCLNHGNRTTPLNFAFAHAHGKYAAILDDDDIVFENWVETFHNASNITPGKIIHSYAYAQNWRATPNEINDRLELTAISEYDSKYCTDYSLLRQIEDNHCPLMTLAFPTIYFKKLGLIFDEDLTTTEDWDYFMRLSFLCGVENVPVPTAVYRFWENAENSASLHQLKEWQDNFELIQKKFLNMPILIPAGEKKRQILVIDNTQPPISFRAYLKQTLCSMIPNGLLQPMLKVYRLLFRK